MRGQGWRKLMVIARSAQCRDEAIPKRSKASERVPCVTPPAPHWQCRGAPRRLCSRLAMTIVLTQAAVASFAQTDYPVKPVRVIVGQAPGGGNDIQTRLFAQKLTESL